MMQFKLTSNLHHKNEAVYLNDSCGPSHLELKINVMLFSLEEEERSLGACSADSNGNNRSLIHKE